MSETTVIAYWEELRDYELQVVLEALQRVRKISTRFMPAAPEVVEHAEVVAKTWPKQPQPQRLQLAPPAEPQTCNLPEDNPFMKLARSWEEESRRLGLNPDLPSPDEIAKRRFAQLNALLAGRFS